MKVLITHKLFPIAKESLSESFEVDEFDEGRTLSRKQIILAVQEYDADEIHSIYDRLSHCFLNHQFYVLEEYRAMHGRQWEAALMNRSAMYRSEYTGMLLKNGIEAHKSNSINTDTHTISEQVVNRYKKKEDE